MVRRPKVPIEKILYKDNAQPELKPPHVARRDHAPPGAVGMLIGTGQQAPGVPEVPKNRPPPPPDRSAGPRGGDRPPPPPDKPKRPEGPVPAAPERERGKAFEPAIAKPKRPGLDI